MIDNPSKLYSQRSIALATYLGGPLAAGFLIRRNFINTGNEQFGKHSIFIGIVSTILIFAGVFSIPEQILDQIPNPLIPAIYTGIVYLIVERFFGQTLKDHKENDGLFYSGWNAAGIGAICMVILAGGIFGYAYFDTTSIANKGFETAMTEFQKNEEEALELFTLLETEVIDDISNFINTTGIPCWENNIAILNSIDTISDLKPEIMSQNRILKEYCNLRIESYKLIERTYLENTDSYVNQIENIHLKIDEILAPIIN